MFLLFISVHKHITYLKFYAVMEKLFATLTYLNVKHSKKKHSKSFYIFVKLYQ